MSVTSSGRSSTRTTIRWHSGLFVVIALAIAGRIIVLPAFDGDTISARWPLPIGVDEVDDAGGQLVAARSPGAAARWGTAGSASRSPPGCWRPRGPAPFTVSMRTMGLNFCRDCSPSRGWRTAPVIGVATAQAVAGGPSTARRTRRRRRPGSRWSARTRSCRARRGCPRPARARRRRGSRCRPRPRRRLPPLRSRSRRRRRSRKRRPRRPRPSPSSSPSSSRVVRSSAAGVARGPGRRRGPGGRARPAVVRAVRARPAVAAGPTVPPRARPACSRPRPPPGRSSGRRWSVWPRMHRSRPGRRGRFGRRGCGAAGSVGGVDSPSVSTAGAPVGSTDGVVPVASSSPVPTDGVAAGVAIAGAAGAPAGPSTAGAATVSIRPGSDRLAVTGWRRPARR